MSESGKVKGTNNVKAFDEFVNQHNKQNDWHKYVNVRRNKLKRELICEECGFGKSALSQNPTLKNKFENLQRDLGQKGILITQPSQQLNFEYSDQEVFIKVYEKKINQFKEAINKFEELVNTYAHELEILENN